MTVVVPPYTLPIPERPSRTWAQSLNAILFFLVFNFACLMINGTQLAFLAPLRVLPFAWSRKLYEEGIRYTKGSFGCLLGESVTAVRSGTCQTAVISFDVPVVRANKIYRLFRERWQRSLLRCRT